MTRIFFVPAICAAILTALYFPLAKADVSDLHYVVRPGDTLSELARQHLRNRSQWTRLQKRNKVEDPLKLRPGSILLIPRGMLKPVPMPATVLHASGVAHVIGREGQEQSILTGDQVAEGAELKVESGAFVTLRLADGSTIRLPSGTQVRLQELRFSPESKDTVTRIQLQHGRVESQVVPLASPASRFEVRTPLAVGGVRGTLFGIAVAENGDFIGDVREGAVRVETKRQARVRSGSLLRAGDGTRVGRSDATARISSLLPAPDLSKVPAVLEDPSFVNFTLAGQPGSLGFDVRIASDKDFENVMRNAVVRDGLVHFSGLKDGLYQLAVREIDRHGIEGLERVRELRIKAQPQPPLIREPRQGSRLYSPAMRELLCTESPDLVGYHLQLSQKEDFSTLLFDEPNQSSCAFRIDPLAPGNYLWRVAAIRVVDGQRDQGPWSKPVQFKIVALPPAPEDVKANSSDSDSPTVEWSSVGDGAWKYRLQLSRDAGFHKIIEDVVLNEPRYVLTPNANGRYYLRVLQTDPDGQDGVWSRPQILALPLHLMTEDLQPVLSGDGRPVRMSGN